jgi:nucleotide-binding universal stress UspA family protein
MFRLQWQAGGMTMIAVKRVLVPTDFSETSDAALKYGIGLTKAFDARLYLLHITGESGVNFEADFPMVQFEHAVGERLERFVSQDEATALRPEYALRTGSPSDEIVRYAGDRDIDLIVMGTHGRSGVPHMLMGSVAEKVVRAASCPVLTVRHPRRPFIQPEAGAAARAAQERLQAFATSGSRTLHRVSRIRGAEVNAVDGYIGRLEEFYFDDATWTIRYLVVDTGSWLARHPVLISPEAVKGAWGLAGFNVMLTREQVRSSPEIDPQLALSRQDEERVLGHFGHPLYWTANGRSGSTANLCSTKEVTGDHVQARDGEVGHVDDFLIDEVSWRVEYLVVDTSNWVGGKWVLLAPTTLKGVDWPNSKLRVGLTRDAVKQSPVIDSVTISPGEDGPPFMIL